eukprot:1159019-Pelagomonas_calceolata.AAC.6
MHAHVCVPWLQVLTFAKQAAASPDPQHRCGAMTVLAVMCEGCAELLRKRLEEDILPLVLAGLRVRLSLDPSASALISCLVLDLEPKEREERQG